jgi:transcriptional regulator with XRE-family HTH domain
MSSAANTQSRDDRITLSALRVRLGMTEHDLAEKAGLTENDVIAIEAGQPPTRPQLDALAAALNVHAASLDVNSPS